MTASTPQAIQLSERSIAFTQANPSKWHRALHDKSNDDLRALGESGGMPGFSCYCADRVLVEASDFSCRGAGA